MSVSVSALAPAHTALRATITFDAENEAVLATPTCQLGRNRVFKAAYQRLFPEDRCGLTAYEQVNRNPFCMERLDVLTPRQVQVVNSVGVDALSGIVFHVVPKRMLPCVMLRDDWRVEFDRDVHVLQRLIEMGQLSRERYWQLAQECRVAQVRRVHGIAGCVVDDHEDEDSE